MTQTPRLAQPPIKGCLDFKLWLIDQGFKILIDPFKSRFNACNWYACRYSALPARQCETNEGKPVQIVITPFDNDTPETPRRLSAEINITGEAASTWFKIEAYSLDQDEVRSRLPEIERMLVNAWNALAPDPKQGAYDGTL